MPVWHLKTVEETFADLESTRDGLPVSEAEHRLSCCGLNELQEKRRCHPLHLLFSQFGDFSIIVLIVAAIIAGIIGDITDALAIFAIVLLNAIIGFTQQYRAEKAVAALRKLAGQSATVVRESHPLVIPVSEIVPGDIVLIETGNVIPADLRLVETVQLNLDESLLTGESVPVEKITDVLTGDELPLGERSNLAFKGTIVTTGRGMGVVVATGLSTEFGRIAVMLQQVDEGKTPLQRRLAAFGKRLALVILAICGALFLIGLFRGEPLVMMLLIAVSLAVAAIPEALPAVVTISLALGARKLVQQNALIRRLPAVETLGSVTFICADKTGTLTQNSMTVSRCYVDGVELTVEQALHSSSASVFFYAMALCNDVRTDGGDGPLGNPTELALCKAAQGAGFVKSKLANDHPLLGEIPFDSGRKLMTTCHPWRGHFLSLTKGAAEELLPRARGILINGKIEDISNVNLTAVVEGFAGQGLRVLCLAMREWETLPPEMAPEVMETGLTLIGMVGLHDPPRPEASVAVESCRKAGITPVMITGDHPATALSIARELGIIDGLGDEVLSGKELARLSAIELQERAGRVRVYARVAPEQKLAIVQALQSRGECVAMTGDGVNDAPALQRADIGVSMGMTGTDVAREASAMVLLDDNFATIVSAVQEGRRIYRNILRFIGYSITSNLGTLTATVAAPLFGLPLPLLPTQILWLNLLCDSLPGLALASEPAEKDILAQPPISPSEGVFASGRGSYMIRHGMLFGGITIIFQSVTLAAGLPWQTMVFTFLVAGRMAVALSGRSRRHTLAEIGPFGNRSLTVAIVITLLLQSAVIYLPPFHRVFATVPLTIGQLAMVVGASMIVLVVGEGEKVVLRIVRRRAQR